MQRSLLRTAWDGIIESRERRARFHTVNALMGLDDETLQRAGYDRTALKRGVLRRSDKA